MAVFTVLTVEQALTVTQPKPKHSQSRICNAFWGLFCPLLIMDPHCTAMETRL